MKYHKLKPLNHQLVVLFGSATLGLLSMQAAQAQSLETVTITGSAIKRSLESQQALPVTTYSVEELKSTGVTSTEEIVQRIVSSQSSQSGSTAVGSSTGGASQANLRGLGSNKTLVLLNGRRLAFFGIGASAVDLNGIPFAALERVEVLRDGASAIYGTDAVGGVINFITRRNYSGLDVAVERTVPSQSGGGDIARQTFSGGTGNLQKDGYNFWFSVDKKKQTSLAALSRDFAATGVIPSVGLNKTSGTTFPANFNYYDLTGAIKSGNLTAASKCAPPASIWQSGSTCRYDYTSAIDIIPETENLNINARGTFNLGGDRVLTLEAVQSENRNIARVAPDPVTGLSMPTTSPYYPATFAGIDATKNLFGIGWRMVPAGQRENTSIAKANRFVADLTGVTGAWDYKAGIFTTSSEVSDGPTNGYVSKSKIQSGVTSGLLNPFGTNTAAGIDYINTAKAFGTFSSGKGTVTGVDARFNREMFKLDGGASALSLGVESRNESFTTDTDDALVNGVPSAGRAPYHVNGASRTVSALMAEALFPVTKQLELTLAARFDRYSDFGTTLNPKAGFRYTASPTVLFRGSVNTGFRAPTLDDLYGPQSLTFTGNDYNDPVLCPNGVVAAGGIQSRDCGQQYQALTGGNRDLQPEKSRAFSLGTALQPTKDLLFTVDYWNIGLTNQILPFPEQTAATDPSRIVRCNTLSATEAARAERCNIVAGSNAVAYLRTLTDNLGDAKTHGLDFSAAWAKNLSGVGRLSLNYDGTFVSSYQFQRTIGGEFVENVGAYVDDKPVFRWRHYLSATLAAGKSRYSVGLRHLSGYTDQNPDPAFLNEVKAYTLVDAGYTYTGIKNLNLGFVVRNVFDEKPPFSNQGTVFQQGYDPRYTDPLGRSLVMKLSYKFF